MKARRVAFQGEHGAFSEDAVRAHFGEEPETIPCQDFLEAFSLVEMGKATHAVLPVENSIEGTVAQVNDLLLEHDLVVTGEAIIPINQCLIGLQGTRLEEVHTVFSHPQALAQCRRFLDQYARWRRIPVYDTAGSVKMVREAGDRGAVAIASSRSAEVYGMEVLREAIQSEAHNFTRFFVVEKDPAPVEGADKTSLVFAVKNVPGSVYQCLGELANRGINLTKLESRPRKGRPWSYVFFADLDGNVDEPRVKEAVGALLRTAGFIKILGSYRAARPPGPH